MHVDGFFVEILQMENFATKMFEISAEGIWFFTINIILSMYFRFSNFVVGKQTWKENNKIGTSRKIIW